MLTRRALVAGTVALPMLTTNAACAQKGSNMVANGAAATLVAYLTRSGNTRMIAERLSRMIAEGLSRMLGAGIVEIRPRTPYPADYQAHVDRAQQERDNNILPPMDKPSVDLSRYTALYLGFPIWGGTVPQVVQSFLALRDWKGVSVHPFITHGGYDIGDSRAVLGTLLPDTQVSAPFVREMDQERRTLEAVKHWLKI